jgi:hypothetical protein
MAVSLCRCYEQFLFKRFSNGKRENEKISKRCEDRLVKRRILL